jgi:hypothetical protein
VLHSFPVGPDIDDLDRLNPARRNKRKAGESVFSTALEIKKAAGFGLPTASFVFSGYRDIQRVPGRPLLKK